jgi:hypothetical protein
LAESHGCECNRSCEAHRGRQPARKETDGWPGKSIELYPSRTSMGGKTMDCIRVRGTSQQTFSDEVPF